MIHRRARALAAAGTAAWLGFGGQLCAAESLTVELASGRAVTVTVKRVSGDVLMADVRALALQLDLVITQDGDRVAIRDTGGTEWRTANGSLLLDSPSARRILKGPALITGREIYLPIESIAELAGRTIVVENGAARMTVRAPAAVPDVRGPAGWQAIRIQKSDVELAEQRRLEGDQTTAPSPSGVKDVLPPAHDSMAFDVGLGFAQGMSGAADVVASGTASGLRLTLNAFVTYGRDGALYRSSRLTVRAPADRWWLEAGDLLSDVRGLARGVRIGKALRPWWRPSLSMYAPTPNGSAGEASAVAYRDELQPTPSFGVRAETTSRRSAFLGARWLKGRASVETFFRSDPNRSARDSGATASYDLWQGIAAQVSARVSSGPDRSRWYSAALTVPVASLASVSLERTRSTGIQDAQSSAFGLQVPIGRLHVMHRYQWTDVGFIREPAIGDASHRQLQSTASFSPTRRVQMTYQLATQWFADATARQWSELQSVFNVSPATSLHAVTGFPDVANIQRFRVGLQQNLSRGFRLAVDYGALPAFQSSIRDRQEHSRLLVMVRRNLGVATRAAGSEVKGRVIGQSGEGVAGAVVTLGAYRTTARADGGYHFAHVPDGDYDLALDAAHLPARYAPDGVKHRVYASSGRQASIDLYAIPLHAIHGHVFVDRNANGEFDPGEGVPNVVLVLSGNGLATVTDETGAYGFYNLIAAHYVVRLDVERLSQDLTAVSPAAAEVDLAEDGRARTAVDLQVTPRQKPIVMQKISKP